VSLCFVMRLQHAATHLFCHEAATRCNTPVPSLLQYRPYIYVTCSVLQPYDWVTSVIHLLLYENMLALAI